MMRILIILFILLGSNTLYAQKDTEGKVLWGFPITDYMVPLSKGVDVVQIKLPTTLKFIQGKQLGVLRGIARGTDLDTGSKGWGKCHLIKGVYNYFSIHLDSNKKPRTGDLLYTYIPKTTFLSLSPLLYCAAHNITFLSVTDTAFYTPAEFLNKRSKLADDLLLATMVKDISYTGAYYQKNDPSMDKQITDGPYKNRSMFDVMVNAKKEDLTAFLGYVAARPLRYAGNKWKVSETFATWLISGAPMVIAN